MAEKRSSHHQRILADVRSNILRGSWPPGWRIPFETDMAHDYGVSRMTVNKALTQLAREGFLDRRRKGGTFVAAPRHRSAVMEITDLRREVEKAGQHHSVVLLQRAARAAEDLDRHRLQNNDPDLQVLALTALHRADGAPYCLEDRLINLAAVPEARHADFSEEPAGSWLLRQVPWSSAEHTIRAVAATAADGKLLNMAAGAPCLEISRITRHDGQPLTAVRLTYPGSQHQLVARFMPQS